MACVNVTSIIVKDNPAPLFCPFKFLITFEALTSLNEDLEWRIIYVGDRPSNASGTRNVSSHMETQPPEEIELDCVALRPIRKGVLTFEFAVNPPDFNQMDPDSILGMQAVLVTASYKKHEFIRIGYFLNNMYADPALRGVPPIQPQLDKIVRCIIDDTPRVTRYPIHWDESNRELLLPWELESLHTKENESHDKLLSHDKLGYQNDPGVQPFTGGKEVTHDNAQSIQFPPSSNDISEDVEMLAL